MVRSLWDPSLAPSSGPILNYIGPILLYSSISIMFTLIRDMRLCSAVAWKQVETYTNASATYWGKKNKVTTSSSFVCLLPSLTKSPHTMENLKDIVAAVLQGVWDSLRGEPKILQRTIQCCALNGGVFWLSLLVFYSVVLPLIQRLMMLGFELSGQTKFAMTVWSWTSPLLSATFSALWVLPLFVLSKVVNSLWFQDIADTAYKYSRGRPQLLPSVSKLIADILFSMLIQALFLIQAMLVGLLPIAVFNTLLSMLHMCLLYSLYAFEYRWFNMGWELPKRLTFIENHWPYFVGFGLPLVVLTSWPSSYLVSGCVFSILFPLFIISGNEAVPVTGIGHFPLRLFSPVVALANALLHKTIGRSSLVARQR